VLLVKLKSISTAVGGVVAIALNVAVINKKEVMILIFIGKVYTLNNA